MTLKDYAVIIALSVAYSIVGEMDYETAVQADEACHQQQGE